MFNIFVVAKFYIMLYVDDFQKSFLVSYFKHGFHFPLCKGLLILHLKYANKGLTLADQRKENFLRALSMWNTKFLS